MIIHSPVNMDLKKYLYLEPVQVAARDAFLQLVKKHGNGMWAIEELNWLIYTKHKDRYNALNEQEKYDLDMFMKSFTSLYK